MESKTGLNLGIFCNPLSTSGAYMRQNSALKAKGNCSLGTRNLSVINERKMVITLSAIYFIFLYH